MRRFLFFSAVLALALAACQNPLEFQPVDLPEVEGHALINSGVLKEGEDYSIGYANGNIRSDRITLTWQPCADPEFLSYKVFRDGQLVRTLIDPSSTQATDSLLSHNTVYDYRIAAFIKSGMAVQDTIKLKTPRFLVPNEISYTLLSPTSARITWTNRAESATGFTVEKERLSNGDTDTFQTATPYLNDNSIVSGENYRYRIKARNAFEETAFSSWQNFTFTYVMAPPVLNEAEQLFPSEDVRLSWTDNSTAETSFRVQRAVAAPNDFILIGETAENVAEFTDTSDKVYGQTYFYRVQAYNQSEFHNSNVLSIIVTEAQFVIFDFEADNGGFSSNDGNGWQWGISSILNAHSGSRLWGSPLDGGYPNSANFQLTSPTLAITPAALLEFWHNYSVENSWDGGNVKISTDNGASWTVIHPQGGYPDNNINSSGEPGYTDSSGGWVVARFDLSAYANQSAKFRWTFTSDNSVTATGWFIDDVKVGSFKSNSPTPQEESCASLY